MEITTLEEILFLSESSLVLRSEKVGIQTLV